MTNKEIKDFKRFSKIISEITNRCSTPIKYKAGDKVKFNFTELMLDKNFHRKKREYKHFIETHKFDIMTVAETKGTLVTLVEDETNPKWYFYQEDLERVKK